MGRLAKGVLLLLGVLMLGSLWEASVLIFAYLLLPPLFRRKGRGGGERRLRIGWNKTAGVLLLALSVVAVAEGGRLSPFAFGVPGALLLVGESIPAWTPRPKPIVDSVLVRGSVNPFRWGAVAELKFATRDVARVLSGVEGRILFLPGHEPRVFALFEALSPTRKGAERALVGEMRAFASGLVSLGTYVFPLDSEEAARACALPARRRKGEPLLEEPSQERVAAALLEARGGEVNALEFFAGGGGRSSALGQLRGRPRTRVLTGELVRPFLSGGPPRADELTAFLAEAAATSGEALGERITELTTGDCGIRAVSPGGTKVSLTRAQFLAVTAVYP